MCCGGWGENVQLLTHDAGDVRTIGAPRKDSEGLDRVSVLTM